MERRAERRRLHVMCNEAGSAWLDRRERQREKKKEKKSVAKDTQTSRSTVIGCANACLFWQTNTQINSTACAFGRIYSSAPQFPYYTKLGVVPLQNAFISLHVSTRRHPFPPKDVHAKEPYVDEDILTNVHSLWKDMEYVADVLTQVIRKISSLCSCRQAPSIYLGRTVCRASVNVFMRGPWQRSVARPCRFSMCWPYHKSCRKRMPMALTTMILTRQLLMRARSSSTRLCIFTQVGEGMLQPLCGMMSRASRASF